jgi:hypothetical protein
MRRTILTVAILPALLGTVGCFDVHSVDQGPWVIDDFEDGDMKPADSNFGIWNCQTFNPANQIYSCGLDLGDQSAHSLFLDSTIVEPADGMEEGGALVQTVAARPEDFSRFYEMTFSLKVASGNPLPPGAQVNVALGCSTVQLEDGTVPGYINLQQSIAFSNDWKPFPLAMANFGFPTFEDVKVVGGSAACLERVDDIAFVLSPELPDGQSATSRLNVDDIYFQ